MPDWEKWLGLETFNDPQLSEMVKVVAEYLMAFKYKTSPPCWLTIMGRFGTGKTHCAKRAFRYISNRCDWSGMDFLPGPIYWPGFVNSLRDGTGYEKIRELQVWPVLMLDDIGAERDPSGFSSEQLNTLLGTRVGSWTILTSNLNLEQIASIDPRMADRIIREKGNRFVTVDTISYGLRRKK